jgi:hypothetical protein
LDNIIKNQEILLANELLNDSYLVNFQTALLSSAEYGQKILSSVFITDPYNPEVGTLPISFRLMGQRFIVDSYILSNLVYDKIVYNNQKVWRPMPDPLDVMFVLGNDNALPLLENELSTFNYSCQIAAQRYLIDSYDVEFWNQSLYNTWLQAIRFLNPVKDNTEYPDFMKTVAWQQEKLNAQLASWTQLRHDNLLYAKQSYTAAGGCIFPHTFVEPYPEFYGQIEIFAQNAESFFSEIGVNEWIVGYFKNLKEITNKLKIITIKEIEKVPFNSDEVEFLSSVLDSVENSCGLWVSGWYGQLYYDGSKMTDHDFLVADVHTQPTDQIGNTVGKVLHVGVGKVNLGVFLTESPSDEFNPTAYVGPVMSYYEKIEEDFKRLTDQEWSTIVINNNLPQRPDWQNVFIADSAGNMYPEGRELSGEYITGIFGTKEIIQKEFILSQNYPNPFNPSTTIKYSISTEVGTARELSDVNLKVYDILGREVATLVNKKQKPGNYEVIWDASEQSSGVYFYQIQAGEYIETKKMILLR